MTAVSILPRGTNFARIAYALARAKGEGLQAHAMAAHLWGENSIPTLALKQTIAAGSTGSLAALAEYRTAAADFMEGVFPATILGRMQGMRSIPLHTRVPAVTSSTTLGWVGQGSPTPLTGLTLNTVTFDLYKIAGIVVTTDELAKLSAPQAEGVIRQDLTAATIKMLDQALLDPTAAGEADVSPASITYGAPSFAASGTSMAALRADLRRLFNLVIDAGIELVSPYLITSRQQALALALSDQDFVRDITIRGGMLAGVPLLASTSSPSSTDTQSPPQTTSDIVLVDAGEMLVNSNNEITIETSHQATLQMDTAPDSPVTGNTVMVSLYQQNLRAWMIKKPANWKMRRAGAVARITGANYGE